MLISQAAPLATSLGQTVTAAAGFVALVSVFNATGRLFWSWLSDLIGRRQVFMTMFGLQAVIFAVLAFTGKSLGFTTVAALLLIVALCYGGGFGSMPAFTADYFGAKYAGAIYGTMLTAWSVGGILGPILIAQVKDRTGGYTAAFGIIAVVMLASLLLPIFTRAPQVAGEAPQTAAARAQTGQAG
jgi:OFA family oxalate/formate antiporter-like MFS transporter